MHHSSHWRGTARALNYGRTWPQGSVAAAAYRVHPGEFPLEIRGGFLAVEAICLRPEVSVMLEMSLKLKDFRTKANTLRVTP